MEINTDLRMNITKVPLEIKEHIFSFLYFTKEQSISYSIINQLISNYSIYIYNALLIQYNHNQIYRSLLRWINNYENEQLYKYISSVLNINYEIHSEQCKEKQNLLIMKEMPFFGLQHFYKSFITYV